MENYEAYVPSIWLLSTLVKKTLPSWHTGRMRGHYENYNIKISSEKVDLLTDRYKDQWEFYKLSIHLQKTQNTCYGMKLRNIALHQVKMGKHEYVEITYMWIFF